MSLIDSVTPRDIWDLLHVRHRWAQPAPVATYSDPDAVWDLLQQPIHPDRIDPRYRQLLSALDTGWQIEEPIYLRPRWSDNRSRVYHFILRRAHHPAPRLMTISESPEMTRWVRDQGLAVQEQE